MDSPLEPVFFECEQWGKSYNAKRNLLKHQSLVHGRTKTGFKCCLCGETITNQDVYVNHLSLRHDFTIEEERMKFDSTEGK